MAYEGAAEGNDYIVFLQFNRSHGFVNSWIYSLLVYQYMWCKYIHFGKKTGTWNLHVDEKGIRLLSQNHDIVLLLHLCACNKRAQGGAGRIKASPS